MKHKIGIGIITYNRFDFFLKCFQSIHSGDEIVVVNDGSPYREFVTDSNKLSVIQHKKNLGIARSKNDVFKYLMSKNCEHIFVLEDDIMIKNNEIFVKYIKASENSGIKHFNYAFHGPWNIDERGNTKFRYKKQYDIESTIIFTKMLTGALSYYRRGVLEKVGGMDTVYKNVLEHVDHTFKIIKAGFHPPFYWFADVKESFEFVEELDRNLARSVLRRNRKLFNLKVRFFNYYFKLTHGYFPHNIPDATVEELEAFLYNTSVYGIKN